MVEASIQFQYSIFWNSWNISFWAVTVSDEVSCLIISLSSTFEYRQNMSRWHFPLKRVAIVPNYLVWSMQMMIQELFLFCGVPCNMTITTTVEETLSNTVRSKKFLTIFFIIFLEWTYDLRICFYKRLVCEH